MVSNGDKGDSYTYQGSFGMPEHKLFIYDLQEESWYPGVEHTAALSKVKLPDSKSQEYHCQEALVPTADGQAEIPVVVL